jgi:hypothetical protein
MAKLKAFVTSLDDVAEEFRGLYVEDVAPDRSKRFKLDAEGLEDVTGLKGTVRALREEVRGLKERTEPLAELPDDVDVAAVIAAGRTELERQRTGAARDEVKSATEQMRKLHEKEVAKLQAKINGQASTLNEVLIQNEVRAVAADKEIKGSAKLLMPHVERQTRVVEITGDDGQPKFVTRVLAADGKTERVDGQGNPLSIRALVAEMRGDPDYAGAFEGSGASGSGTPPDGGSGMPTPPRTPAARTADDKETKRRTQGYSAI